MASQVGISSLTVRIEWVGGAIGTPPRAYYVSSEALATVKSDGYVSKRGEVRLTEDEHRDLTLLLERIGNRIEADIPGTLVDSVLQLGEE